MKHVKKKVSLRKGLIMNVIKGYTYDDVLLIPKKSSIKHRSDINLIVDWGKGIKTLPIVSANMKHVTDYKMALRLADNKCMDLLHRFDSKEDRNTTFRKIVDIGYTSFVGTSFGVVEDEIELFKTFYNNFKNDLKIVCIDIAHGHSDACIKAIQTFKNIHPDCLLIAGNIATLNGAYDLWIAGADVVKCGIGNGCFASGTRILMSNGRYKNIEDVKDGDRIINKDGNPKTVLKSFSTGIKKVSKLRNSIFYKDTFVTKDHNYFINDLNSVSKQTIINQKYVNILTEQSKTIPKQDKLKWQEIGYSDRIAFLMPRNIKFELPETFEIPIYTKDGRDGKYKLDFILKPSYELGYIFGTFLVDGCACCHENKELKSNSGRVSWYFGLEDNIIIEKLRNCIKTIFNKDFITDNSSTANLTTCHFYYKPFADYLFSFGKKTEKFLPENLLINNKEYLQGMSDGLIDSDGYVEKNRRINFNNTSIKLIELFNVITYLLTGIFPNNGNLKGNKIENIKQFYVCTADHTADKRVLENYQVSKLLEFKEDEFETEVFDLTIDDNTHSFIADNAIVHNSSCSTRIETGNGVPQLTALDFIWQHFKSIDDRPKIIADGGLSKVGSIVKALCFADGVMIGNMLAGTEEFPGDIISKDGKQYKIYAGSSTFKSNNVEGYSGLVPYKGPVEFVIKKIKEGLQSGCSYQGVDNVDHLKTNPKFVSITNAGVIESGAHDMII